MMMMPMVVVSVVMMDVMVPPPVVMMLVVRAATILISMPSVTVTAWEPMNLLYEEIVQIEGNCRRSGSHRCSGAACRDEPQRQYAG